MAKTENGPEESKLSQSKTDFYFNLSLNASPLIIYHYLKKGNYIIIRECLQAKYPCGFV